MTGVGDAGGLIFVIPDPRQRELSGIHSCFYVETDSRLRGNDGVYTSVGRFFFPFLISSSSSITAVYCRTAWESVGQPA